LIRRLDDGGAERYDTQVEVLFNGTIMPSDGGIAWLSKSLLAGISAN
jgi:hypothetical protein